MNQETVHAAEPEQAPVSHDPRPRHRIVGHGTGNIISAGTLKRRARDKRRRDARELQVFKMLMEAQMAHDAEAAQVSAGSTSSPAGEGG